MPVTPVIVRDGDVALLFYQPTETEDAH